MASTVLIKVVYGREGRQTKNRVAKLFLWGYFFSNISLSRDL